MKNLLLATAFLFCIGAQSALAQNSESYPIPSYDLPLSSGEYEFTDEGSATTGTDNAEKRDMEVVISSSSHAPGICATVWFYKNKNWIEGPFTVYVNEPFSYSLNPGKWTVIVKTEYDVTASVWSE